MTPIEKIHLSFRCNNDIKKMTPCSSGLHCSGCNKTVIDFRESSLSQLTEILEKQGEVCGIFTKGQTVHKPKKLINTVRRYAASVLLAVGLGVFNKDVMAQDTSSDTLIRQEVMEHDSFEFFLGMIDETMPSYKNGGDKGLIEFIKNNLNYPDSIQGRVVVGFTVDTTGKVINAKILKGLNEMANKEVLRVVGLLEFIPGTRNGKKVPVNYTLPVLFRDDERKKKR